MKRLFVVVQSIPLVVLSNCGGARTEQPPAAAATEQNAAAPAAKPPPASQPAASATVDEAPPPSPKDSLPPPQPEPAPRPPSDIIGAPRVAYMINYPSSAVRRMDAAKCDKKTGGNPQLHAECMNKARNEFVSDVLVFRKDDERWYWYIYKRNHGTLFEVSRTPIEFGEETDDTVEVLVKGNSKGTRPLFIGKKEILVKLPTKYSIELDDPRYGPLVYDSKIGLVDDD